MPGRWRTTKPSASVSVHATMASAGSPSAVHGARKCWREAPSPSVSWRPTARRSIPPGAGAPLQLKPWKPSPDRSCWAGPKAPVEARWKADSVK
ncbi:hypothetical protein SCALM49S_08822 [Streptomyces californicus]